MKDGFVFKDFYGDWRCVGDGFRWDETRPDQRVRAPSALPHPDPQK